MEKDLKQKCQFLRCLIWLGGGLTPNETLSHLNGKFVFDHGPYLGLIKLEGVGRYSPLSKVGDQNSKLDATIKSWGLTVKVGDWHQRMGKTSKNGSNIKTIGVTAKVGDKLPKWGPNHRPIVSLWGLTQQVHLGTWRPIVFNVLDEWIMSKCLKFAEMTDKFTKKNPLK